MLPYDLRLHKTCCKRQISVYKPQGQQKLQILKFEGSTLQGAVRLSSTPEKSVAARNRF
jgi:hypothetical protein